MSDTEILYCDDYPLRYITIGDYLKYFCVQSVGCKNAVTTEFKPWSVCVLCVCVFVCVCACACVCVHACIIYAVMLRNSTVS